MSVEPVLINSGKRVRRNIFDERKKMTDTNHPKIPSVAVVGSGYWGKNLVRSFNQLNALKLICDKQPVVLESFNKAYPKAEVCSNYDAVLSRKDIDAIVIATPAETHFDLAMKALDSGKHVYVEKPLVLNEKDGKNLIKLADQSNKILMVGHLLQYHPVFVKLKSLIKNGDLGRINYIYSNRLNLGKFRREENILWSFAPHDISMILTIAGEMPNSVIATGANYLHGEIADVTITHLVFPSGIRAHIYVSWLHPFKEQKLVVIGDQKMAVFDDTQPWESKLLLYPHRITWENNLPVPDRAEAEIVDVHPNEPLLCEGRHFINCIIEGSKPLTDGSEGLRVLKILNASQMSIDGDGQRVIIRKRLSRSPLEEHFLDKHFQKPEEKKPYFVHQSAMVDLGAKIGNDTKIWHFSHIMANTLIGKNCNIGQNVVIGPDVTIGDGCKIQNNVSVYKGVTLENEVFCGPSMVFTNIINPRAALRKMDQVRPTLVKKGATIGANATILCGATLGRYAFVGAGSVVTREVPDFALVVGNPARQVGWVCECGERLDQTLTCPSCTNHYRENKGSLRLSSQ